jgi:hypothetical protein
MGIVHWPIIKLISSYVQSHPPLVVLYKVTKVELRANIWDKVRSYMEHLGNLMGTYENTLGTSHGNISRTKTSQHPTFPQKKKNTHLIGCNKCFYLLMFLPVLA